MTRSRTTCSPGRRAFRALAPRHGCGKWFHAARDTATLEVFGTYSAQTTEPPDDIVAAIRARRPEWEGPA
jgi:hypothetical protein